MRGFLLAPGKAHAHKDLPFTTTSYYSAVPRCVESYRIILARMRIIIPTKPAIPSPRPRIKIPTKVLVHQPAIPKLRTQLVTKQAIIKLTRPLAPKPMAPCPYPELETLVDATGAPIHLDSSQLHAVELGLAGTNFSIIGKAGTGKSTIVQAICLLWQSRHSLAEVSYRIKGTGQRVTAPSVAIVAYTNTAADNIRHKLVAHPDLVDNFGANITTIHNLLEYTVEFLMDPLTGHNKVRYFPQRTKENPLTITHLVVEEGSMVGVGDQSLWMQLFEALPKGVQIVFLGDINQLPPVIGKAILSYALQELPVAELTTVHRCALDNPIIRQALRCIEGKELVEDYNLESGQGVRIFNGTQKIKLCKAYYQSAFTRLMTKMIEAEEFDPAIDMVLSPYFKPNKSKVSATNLARSIARIEAQRHGRKVYEIIAGYNTVYLAVGDRVHLAKLEGVVTRIERNPTYTGKIPREPSIHLDYEGEYHGPIDLSPQTHSYAALDIDAMLDEKEERKRSASHTVHIKPKVYLTDCIGETKDYVCGSTGDFSDLELGYALSIYKAQGSEWPNVVLALHDTNTQQLYRESLYTGITRARERLDIVSQKPALEKARATQRIKGNTLAEKIEYFNSGYLDQVVQIIP